MKYEQSVGQLPENFTISYLFFQHVFSAQTCLIMRADEKIFCDCGLLPDHSDIPERFARISYIMSARFSAFFMNK